MPARIHFRAISKLMRPTEQGHQAGEVLPGEDGPADDLIHGVVPAHVFGVDEDLAVGAGQGHGVGAAGVLEDGLDLMEPVHEADKRCRRDGEGAGHLGDLLTDLADRLFGAEAATGIRHFQVAAAPPGQGRIRQADVHHVGGQHRVGARCRRSEW